MAKKRRRFMVALKKRVALEALRERETVQVIAARHGIHSSQVTAWKRQAVEGPEEVFSRPGPKRARQSPAEDGDGRVAPGGAGTRKRYGSSPVPCHAGGSPQSASDLYSVKLSSALR